MKFPDSLTVPPLPELTVRRYWLRVKLAVTDRFELIFRVRGLSLPKALPDQWLKAYPVLTASIEIVAVAPSL